MAASSDSTQRKLDQTPTWAVASVCAVMIIISILVEKVLHKLGTVCAKYSLRCSFLVFLSLSLDFLPSFFIFLVVLVFSPHGFLFLLLFNTFLGLILYSFP